LENNILTPASRVLVSRWLSGLFQIYSIKLLVAGGGVCLYLTFSSGFIYFFYQCL